jgi:hypothetical protein
MKFSFLFILIIGIASCAPSNFIVPLKKGEHAVSASLGGPLVAIPGIATIPIPNTTLGYGYGISEKGTLSAALYPTAALYGVFQFTGGYTYELWKNNRSHVTAKIGFDLMTDVFEKNTRFWPQLDANYGYVYQNKESDETTKRKLVYAGLSNWFELNRIKALGEKQTNYIFFNPHIGHQIKRNNWAFNFEIALLAPNLSNEKVVLNYKSVLGNQGATGIYFGLQYHFK